MGKAHHAFTGTGAVGLAVAAAIPGTLVADACAGKGGSTVWIGHAAGRMDVVADVMLEKDVWHARGVTLGRTARSLMRGEVLVPL
jgi:2-methylaconitate cis-trans-isomerase PrpF